MAKWKSLKNTPPSPHQPHTSSGSPAANRRKLFSVDEVKRMQEKIAELVEKSPEKAAIILAHWIHSKKK